MKLWNNPFKTQSLKACLCGKDKGTIVVNKVMLQREVMVLAIGAIALMVTFAIVGVADTLARVWFMPAFLGLIIAGITAVTIYRLVQGHSLHCSVRRAVFTVL